MSADTDPRKSPCANTGPDSLQNLPPTLSNNPPMSIQRSRSGARILCGWHEEDRRLEKLFKDTGREIHRLALERHRAGVKEATGRICE